MDELKSTGWCMPSEAAINTHSLPVGRVPQDCGGPHKWEKFAVPDNQCGCSHCGNELRTWIECRNCMMRQDTYVMTDETRAIWEAAPWG